MSASRFIRPFARAAFARPAVFASSKAVVAPFTPSLNAQLQQKKNNAAVPADKMVRLASTLVLGWHIAVDSPPSHSAVVNAVVGNAEDA